MYVHLTNIEGVSASLGSLNAKIILVFLPKIKEDWQSQINRIYFKITHTSTSYFTINYN